MPGYENIIHNVTFGKAEMRDEEDEERSLIGHGRTSAWADHQMVEDRSDRFGRVVTGWNGPNSFLNRAVSSQESGQDGARGAGRRLPSLGGGSNGR
ncbi:unnamed protein product [Linum trigynum]|uniref:Uncharacterized protein n=1 Tax=Linum trigynum TaxID=586398 RepID=A0AAV2FU44_9ROSI